MLPELGLPLAGLGVGFLLGGLSSEPGPAQMEGAAHQRSLGRCGSAKGCGWVQLPAKVASPMASCPTGPHRFDVSPEAALEAVLSR